MAQKPTMEQQVSILTEEQKNNVPKLFWSGIIISVIAIILSVCLLVPLFQAWQATVEAEEAYIEARDENILNCMDELEAWDEAAEKQQDAATLTMVVGGIAWVADLIFFFYIKVKHPYYNDKLFFYLRKHG